jgi:hypothetical protein
MINNAVIIMESRKHIKTNAFVLQIYVILIIVGLMITLPSGLGSPSSRAATEVSGLPDEGTYNFATIADVNNDGYLDIISGSGGYSPSPTPGGLYVFLSQYGNSFTDASSGLPEGSSDFFGSVQAIDINKDSNLDIIASYESRWSKGNSNGIGIWFGNGGSGGSMKWTAATSPLTTGSFDSAYCADIDNDGNLDLVAGGDQGIYAWQGSHTESSLSWTEIRDGLPTSSEFTGVTLGDLNGNSRLDLVAGSYNRAGISVYQCSSSGAISWSEADSETNLVQNVNTFDMHLTDLNSDSKLDLIATVQDGGLRAYLGNGMTGERNTWWTDVSSGLPTKGKYYQISVADVNNDGKLDIGSGYTVWENSGSMTDSESYSWSSLNLGISESSPVGIALGDLDDDGEVDFIGSGWSSGVYAYILDLDSGSGNGGVKIKYPVSGIITDLNSGEPIIGAKVSTSPGGYSALTDNSGKYSVMLPNGTYTISFTKDGFKTSSVSIQVNGATISRDLALEEGTDDKDSKKDDDSGIPFMEAPVLISGLLIITIILYLGQANRRKKI